MTKPYSELLMEMCKIMAEDIVDDWHKKAAACRREKGCSICYFEAMTYEQQMFYAEAAVAIILSYLGTLSSHAGERLIHDSEDKAFDPHVSSNGNNNSLPISEILSHSPQYR